MGATLYPNNVIVADVTGPQATVTNHHALQVTPPPEGKTAFGESIVGQLTPQIQLTFQYNINTEIVDTFPNQSGTVTQATSMAVISTGAAANSSAALLSKDIARYAAGMGLVCRFTALFTTGVANSCQLGGMGNAGEGYFFGYDGTAFGILRRKDGSPEVRALTVSTKSTTAEDITITLDGDAAADVTVSDATATDATTTANEIAAHDYSDIGRGWNAEAVEDTVVFTSWDAAVHTGTYSLSSATTAVGSFAQTVAGVAYTDVWVAQASWNGDDVFDGTGDSGITLDPTKGNIYQIDLQYLGYGVIRFYIADPADGEMHLVHSIEYANANTSPLLNNPSLQLCLLAENFANTSDLVVKSASMAAFIQGVNQNTGLNRGLENTKTLTGTAAETPVMSVRVNKVYQSKINRTKVKFNLLSSAVDHTKPVTIKFYRDAVLTGASFSDVDASTSGLQKDTSASAFTGGVFLFAIPLGRTGQDTLNLLASPLLNLLHPGEVLTATALPNSGNGAEATVSYNVTERF